MKARIPPSAFGAVAPASTRAKFLAQASSFRLNVQGNTDMTIYAQPAIQPTSTLAAPATFVVADFLHGAGAIALMDRSRRLNCAGKVKESSRRRAIALARACRIFLSLERKVVQRRGLPASRSERGMAVLMAEVDAIMRLFWAGSTYQALPAVRSFRRALREYERAVSDAAALLNLVTEIR
jgi:hypothetical protein